MEPNVAFSTFMNELALYSFIFLSITFFVFILVIALGKGDNIKKLNEWHDMIVPIPVLGEMKRGTAMILLLCILASSFILIPIFLQFMSLLGFTPTH